MTNKFISVIVFSLNLFALTLYTSMSANAAHHILMFIPSVYFSWQLLTDKNKKQNPSMRVLFALIVMAWLSVVFNWSLFERPWKAIFQTKYMLISLLSAAAFYSVLKVKSLAVLNRPIKFFLVACSVASVNGVIAILSGYSILRFRPHTHHKSGGMYGMPMSYGYSISLTMTLALSCYMLLKLENKTKKSLLIFLLINAVGMYFAYSRGGNLGFLCGFIFILYLKFEDLIKANAKKFLALGLVLVLSLGYFLSRPAFIDSFMQSRTNAVRVGMIEAAVYAVKENPAWGLGFRNFEKYSVAIKNRHNVQHYPDWGGHAHNNIAEIFTGLGILGGTFFLIWIFLWILELWQGPTETRIFIPFVISFFVSGLFQSTIIDGECAFLIFFIYAFSQALRMYYSNEKYRVSHDKSARSES